MPARRPTSWRSRPTERNSNGSRPQAAPSLRLFTRPAWLAEDRARSRQLLRSNISRTDKADCAGTLAASTRAWLAESLAADERKGHISAIAAPRREGRGRSAGAAAIARAALP